MKFIIGIIAVLVLVGCSHQSTIKSLQSSSIDTESVANADTCSINTQQRGGIVVNYEICNKNESLSYTTGYEGRSGATLTVINHTLNNSGAETLSPLAIRYPNQQTTSQLLNYIQSSGCEFTGEDIKYVQPNNTYQQQIDAIVQKVESQGQQSLTAQEQITYSNLLAPCFGDGGSYEPLGSGLLWRRNMKNGGGVRGAYITNISLQ